MMIKLNTNTILISIKNKIGNKGLRLTAISGEGGDRWGGEKSSGSDGHRGGREKESEVGFAR